MKGVYIEKIIEKMELKVLNPEVDLSKNKVTTSEINRPALQLTGFFNHFETTRPQLIGNVEYSYLKTLNMEQRQYIYEKLFSYHVPCIIFSSDREPDEMILKVATHYETPVLQTDKTASNFMAEFIRWMNVQLAPMISVHGVLVDIFGEGVLIMGESGIGKSETALELVKRGHRLVSDDVVEIRKVSDETLVGSTPEITRHFIELRGIGIVDIQSLFGFSSVRESQSIDLVIKLEDWSRDREYDRLGMEEEYIEFLGNKVVCHNIPVRSGRNLAIVCESAAVNHRQKKMGYNAAQELYKRVRENLNKRNEEDEDDE